MKKLEETFNTVEVVIASLGIVLSLACIILLLVNKNKLQTRLKLLISLLVCDFIMAVLHIIRPFYYFDSIWFTDFLKIDQTEKYFAQTFDIYDLLRILCSDIYFTTQIAALVTMLALAVDILILVRLPLKYDQLMSKRRGNILILSIWLGSFVFVLIFRLIVELDWFRVIDVTWSSSPMKEYVHFVYGGFQVLSNVCFLVFVILYLVIYVEIRKLMVRSPSRETRSSVKAAVTMVIILVAYVVCMMPATWVVLVGVITRNSRLFRKLIVISRCLYVANSVCDPLIYAFRLPEIQNRFKMICGKSGPKPSSLSLTTKTERTTST